MSIQAREAYIPSRDKNDLRPTRFHSFAIGDMYFKRRTQPSYAKSEFFLFILIITHSLPRMVPSSLLPS